MTGALVNVVDAQFAWRQMEIRIILFCHRRPLLTMGWRDIRVQMSSAAYFTRVQIA
ncbi:MAG: hypothetical protein P8173_17445 [Gammaproteobacteria bacterium]|jgi:hypothetical protein